MNDIEELTNSQIRDLTIGETSFKHFVNNIFSLGFDEFTGGDHIDSIADFLQGNKRTARISARDHFKSTSMYAHFMWRLLYAHLKGRSIESHYFSYQRDMAAYHISKIKIMVGMNPFFSECKDLKPTAESIIKYTWDGIHFVDLHPHGLLAFKRGIHCDDVYVDDPFQDPENQLNLSVINKINAVFKTQILDFPKKDGELHVVGTPQTNNDFFFDKRIMNRFKVAIRPAIISEKDKKVLWPEWMNYEELMHRRSEKGEKIFNQEYMCSPSYSEDSYFKPEQITNVVNSQLRNRVSAPEGKNNMVLGWDLGKKNHPSHITVFEIVNGVFIQRYQRFLDGWDYSRQLELVNSLMDTMTVDKGFFDNTRGEMETAIEDNRIHRNLEPVVFTVKVKHDMAAEFSRHVEQQKIELIDDRRMTSQILNVTNDLQAVETPEGHGDSFWSIAMCFGKRSSFAFGFADM